MADVAEDVEAEGDEDEAVVAGVEQTSSGANATHATNVATWLRIVGTQLPIL